MAERAEEGPALPYVCRCESCKHSWEILAQQEIGLVCPKCSSTRIRPPNKRGTYKYRCDACGLKWKKKNSSGGVGFCSTCNNGIPIYPYKFQPDVSIRIYTALGVIMYISVVIYSLQEECLVSLNARNVTTRGRVATHGKDVDSSASSAE